MKILFILPEFHPHSGGGIATYYQHYIKALKPYCRHIKVIVGSGYYRNSSKEDLDGVEVEGLEPLIYRQQLLKFDKFALLPEYRNNVAAAWGMWQQCNAGEGFDVIECTDFGLGYIPWLIHHEKPVVVRMHGSAGQIALHENKNDIAMSVDANMQTELALLSLSDGILTHSQLNKKFWQDLLPATDINYIPPVYRTVINKPVKAADRDATGLVAARIQKWKGPAELCEALSRLITDVKIKWYGRDVAYTNNITTNNHLKVNYPNVWGTKITVNSPVTNYEIIELQRTAKFGVVPSVWDMFNFTCVEFMAAGTPVICADGAGASELIEHGINGYKYPSTSPEALAQCIKSLLSLSDSAYLQMAKAAQQTIQDKLSCDELVATYITEYQRLVSNFKPKQANTFLRSIYAPVEGANSLADVLDRQPLSTIVNYLMKRLLNSLKFR